LSQLGSAASSRVHHACLTRVNVLLSLMSLAVNAPAARMRGGGIATMSTPDCRDAVPHYLKIARASMTRPIVDGYRQSKESTTHHALTLASFRLTSYSCSTRWSRVARTAWKNQEPWPAKTPARLTRPSDACNPRHANAIVRCSPDAAQGRASLSPARPR